MKTQELSGGGRMRKRKKTATPGCTTPGKSTHTSCQGGLCSQASKHLLPSQTPNQATTLIPQPSSLLPPWAVSACTRGTFVSSLCSGGSASDPLQEREHQQPGTRCPAPSHRGDRGVVEAQPPKGPNALHNEGDTRQFGSSHLRTSSLPGALRSPRVPQVSSERLSSPWPSTRPQAQE